MTETPPPRGYQPPYPPAPDQPAPYPPGFSQQPPYLPGPGEPAQQPWAAAYGVPPAQRPPKKAVLPFLIPGIVLTVFVCLGLVNSLLTPMRNTSPDLAYLVGALIGRLLGFALLLAPGITLIAVARRRSRSNKAAGWT